MHAPDHDTFDHVEVDPNSPALKHLGEIAFHEGRRRRAHEIDPTVKWDILGFILSDDGLTPAAKRIAHALLSRYNHSDGFCFPGIETLMSDTGYGRTQTIEGEKALVAREWFSATKARKGNRNLPNRYSPNLAKVGLTGREGVRLPSFESPEKRTVTVRKSEPSKVAHDASDSPEKRILTVRKSELRQSGKLDPNPLKGTQDKITQGRRTAPPSVDTRDALPTGSAVRPHKPGFTIEPAALDGWWSRFRTAYPHKPGLDKARGTFCKIILDGLATVDEIIAGVDRYEDELDLRQVQGANAVRWLTDRRWEVGHSISAEEKAGTKIGHNWEPSPAVMRQIVDTYGRITTSYGLEDFRQRNFREILPSPDMAFMEWMMPE